MMSVFSQEHLIFMTNKEASHPRGNEHHSIMYLMTEFSIIFFLLGRPYYQNVLYMKL